MYFSKRKFTDEESAMYFQDCPIVYISIYIYIYYIYIDVCQHVCTILDHLFSVLYKKLNFICL